MTIPLRLIKLSYNASRNVSRWHKNVNDVWNKKLVSSRVRERERKRDVDNIITVCLEKLKVRGNPFINARACNRKLLKFTFQKSNCEFALNWKLIFNLIEFKLSCAPHTETNSLTHTHIRKKERERYWGRRIKNRYYCWCANSFVAPLPLARSLAHLMFTVAEM